jgi:hypothetical protein
MLWKFDTQVQNCVCMYVFYYDRIVMYFQTEYCNQDVEGVGRSQRYAKSVFTMCEASAD